jgi:hypothetical protein
MTKQQYAAIAGGIFIILFAVGFWYLYTRGIFNEVRAVIDGQPLAGELFITLQDTANKTPDVYSYMLGAGELKSFFGTNRNNMTAAFSADYKKIAYMSRQKGERAYQLYVLDADRSQLQQITNDANRIKREPVWSHNGAYIAYAVQPEGVTGADLSTPNSWQIFITTAAGKTLGVVSGTNPFFSPNDEVLFVLRADGIYAIDMPQFTQAANAAAVTSSQARLVVPSIADPKLPVSRSMKIAVSPDGRRLAWSVPKEGFVRIATVTQWEPLTIEKDKDLKVTAYYSVFSPDSQFVALQQADAASDGKLSNARVVAYKLSNFHSAKVLDLSAYDPSFMWLTAWR